MINKLKEYLFKAQDIFENVVLSLKTYEDVITKFISNNPRTTIWIWLGTLYLTWRLS